MIDNKYPKHATRDYWVNAVAERDEIIESVRAKAKKWKIIGSSPVPAYFVVEELLSIIEGTR